MRLGLYAIAVALLLLLTVLQANAQANTSDSFTLRGWQDSPYFCRYWWANFNLVNGEAVQLQWSTSSIIPTAVDLYLATPMQAGGKWFCDEGPQALYHYSAAFGSLVWDALFTGTYTLVVVNDSPYSVSGTLSVVAGNATVSFSATGYGIARQQICPLFPPYLVEC
jgi:hypothetical protein